MGASLQWLAGERLHLQHGPIDLVISARGDATAVRRSHFAAWRRFQTILEELVGELKLIRAPLGGGPCPVSGVVARRMWRACLPFEKPFITPMAAVAGAVADEILECYRSPAVHAASVNNGGDIALHLDAAERMRVAVVPDIHQAVSRPTERFDFDLTGDSEIRGIATSGWRGRSFSMGIADSVTVLARTAAEADAAATVIGNAVNSTYPGICKQPAIEIQPDSDLGERLVTVDVPQLPSQVASEAVGNARAVANHLASSKLIAAALIICQGEVAVVGSWLNLEVANASTPFPCERRIGAEGQGRIACP